MITYKEYLQLVDNTYNTFNWRYGQTLMNVLHAVNPKKYKELVETEYDCYYNENIVEKTLKTLQQTWNQI